MIRSRLARLDEPMLEILRGAFSALIIKVLGALLAFAFNIVLARLLGANGAGIYFLALSITTIASLISRVGLDNTLLRYIAAGASEHNWEEVRGVYLKAMSIVIPLSVLITLIVELMAPALSISVFDKPELVNPLRWMAFSILPLSLLSLYAEMLKGLKKIPASLSLQSIFVPTINMLILLLLASNMGTIGGSISYLVATLITAIIGGVFWLRHSSRIKSVNGVFNWDDLFKSCLPNYGVAILHKAILPWLPILLLGYWATTEDIGLYSATVRTAMLVSFILLAVNSVIAPKFAALYRQNDMVALGKMARRATWLTTLVACPIVLPMIFFPDTIMSVFGQEFKQASTLLIVLSIGQFINVIFGPVGYLLVMTGNEVMQKNSVLFSAILLFILLIILIPIYGSLGAAISSTLSGILFNYISYSYVKKKLGFSTFLTT